MKGSLGEISEIQVGYQSREAIRALADGEFYLLQARDLDKQHQIDWQNLTRFNPSGATNKTAIRYGDILFLARGYDNYSYLIQRDMLNTLVSNSFYVLRVKSQFILPEFLSWWLNQTPAQDFIKSHRRVGMVPLIPVSAIAKLEVPIPEIDIQKKITLLNELRKKEANLTSELMAKKSALVDAVCLNIINQEEI